MGKKIFISYKYKDSDVQELSGHSFWNPTTVRDYVDKLEDYFDSSNHIYKGESDDEDLSYLSDDAIWDKLKDRIFDSSVTIVMISPQMKLQNRSDRSQWIPWEISFSLKETTRNDRTSHSNAILAIVLPDINGSYEYFFTTSYCGATIHHIDKLFKIIRDNMFNVKNPRKHFCYQCQNFHYYGSYSYIEPVRWEDFIKYPEFYINQAVERQYDIYSFEITKEV